jgi:hypothetical protein
MRMFHFGAMRKVAKGAVGENALHVQCPWRIQTNDRIVTGRGDLCEPAEVPADFDWKTWHWDGKETLQDRLVSDLLVMTELTVQEVVTDCHGGVTLSLSDGYALVLFPDGSRAEDWRVFIPDSGKHHFVVSGGHEERDDATIAPI